MQPGEPSDRPAHSPPPAAVGLSLTGESETFCNRLAQALLTRPFPPPRPRPQGAASSPAAGSSPAPALSRQRTPTPPPRATALSTPHSSRPVDERASVLSTSSGDQTTFPRRSDGSSKTAAFRARARAEAVPPSERYLPRMAAGSLSVPTSMDRPSRSTRRSRKPGLSGGRPKRGSPKTLDARRRHGKAGWSGRAA